MFRFTIRELVLAIVIVSLALGWMLDRLRMREVQWHRDALLWISEMQGYKPYITRDKVYVEERNQRWFVSRDRTYPTPREGVFRAD